jgi:hypothetical protein
MEEERDSDVEGAFRSLVTQARNRDKEAMEKLLSLFESEIQDLARFIKMPREDAIQTIKTDFLEMIQSGEPHGKSD